MSRKDSNFLHITSNLPPFFFIPPVLFLNWYALFACFFCKENTSPPNHICSFIHSFRFTSIRLYFSFLWVKGVRFTTSSPELFLHFLPSPVFSCHTIGYGWRETLFFDFFRLSFCSFTFSLSCFRKFYILEKAKNQHCRLFKKHWTVSKKSVQSFSIYTGHLFQFPLILFSVSVQRFSVSVQRFWNWNQKSENTLKRLFWKISPMMFFGLNALRAVFGW